MIRSLASQSDLRRSGEEVRRVILGRLDALVNPHFLALESQWTKVDLGDLFRRTLEPNAVERPDAVDLEGDAMELEPRQARFLSLVLHELATNAVKYGALVS